MTTTLVVAMALTQDSISSDLRLNKITTLDESLAPIETFLTTASSASDVTLSAAPSIKNLKVDVFVDNKPLGETLAKIAETLDLEWARTADGYLLQENAQAANALRVYLSAEDRLADKQLNHRIATYIEVARLVPPSNKPMAFADRMPEYKSELTKAKRALEDAVLRQATDQEIERLTIHRDALIDICSGTPHLQLGRLYSQMSGRDIESYKNGLPYIAANNANAQFVLSNGDVPSNLRSSKNVIFTFVDADTKQIGTKAFGYSQSSRLIAVKPAGRYPFESIPQELKGTDFAASLSGWDQRTKLAASLNTSLDAIGGKKAEFTSPWFGKRFRLGDHLRWFHKTTGLPVIALADRTTHPFMKLNRASKTQGEYLESLLKPNKGFARKSGDFLLVRDGNYWRKALNEIPETTYALVENQKDNPVIESMVAFAARLNTLQATLVGDQEGFVVKFNRFNLTDSVPALQFVSKLSSQQIDTAKTNKGLSFENLNSAQRKLFANAILRGIADQGFVTPQLVDYFGVNGYQHQSLDKMSFHLSQMEMKIVRDAYFVLDESEQVESLPSTSAMRNTTHFEFGYDSDNLIKFYTDL